MKNEINFSGVDFSPEVNLSRYLQHIRQFPILSQEEEFKLAKEYVETKNADLSYILIT